MNISRGNRQSRCAHREVLSYGLHLLTGVRVVLVGFPMGFNYLQRLSQNLKESMETSLASPVRKQPKIMLKCAGVNPHELGAQWKGLEHR